MKKRYVYGLVWAVLLAGCSGKGKKPAADAELSASPLAIEVAYPQEKDIVLSKDYPGYLSADATIALVGRVNGTLQQVNFVPGQRVKKGHLLFVIEPTQYRDAVEQAKAELKTAEASLSYAKNNYDRMKEAIKSNAVSEIQLLQAYSSMEQYEASVQNAKAALNSAQTNLNYCFVKAPCDGQLNISVYSVGAYIAGAGSPVTLATIYKDDKMYSYFNVSDNQWMAQLLNKELTQHQPGQSYYVTIQLNNDSLLKWKAKLDYLSPDISMSTGTLQVRAELENPNGLLKSGSYVTVNLPYADVKDAVLVADASIGTDQLGKYLYVVNTENEVQYRPIKVGQLVDGVYRQVTGGLTGEELYVTKALMKVKQGMKVTPVMANVRSTRP